MNLKFAGSIGLFDFFDKLTQQIVAHWIVSHSAENWIFEAEKLFVWSNNKLLLDTFLFQLQMEKTELIITQIKSGDKIHSSNVKI